MQGSAVNCTLASCSRVPSQDEGVVPGNYVLRRVGELGDQRETCFAAGEVVGMWEAVPPLVVLVEVAGVRGQNYPAAAGGDRDDLRPARVAADQVHRNPWHRAGGPVVQHQAPLIKQLHQLGYVAHLESGSG